MCKLGVLKRESYEYIVEAFPKWGKKIKKYHKKIREDSLKNLKFFKQRSKRQVIEKAIINKFLSV